MLFPAISAVSAYPNLFVMLRRWAKSFAPRAIVQIDALGRGYAIWVEGGTIGAKIKRVRLRAATLPP
jgi:hypothetical protein